MKLTAKRLKTIEDIKKYIPDNVSDWDSMQARYTSYAPVGVDKDMQSDPEGISPEEAFFIKTSEGRLPDKIRDVPKFVSYLWGHRYRNLNESLLPHNV